MKAILLWFQSREERKAKNKNKESGKKKRRKSFLHSNLVAFSFFLYLSVLFAYLFVSVFLSSMKDGRKEETLQFILRNPEPRSQTAFVCLDPAMNINIIAINLPILMKLNINVIPSIFVGLLFKFL
jgi:hypothetical protein